MRLSLLWRALARAGLFRKCFATPFSRISTQITFFVVVTVAVAALLVGWVVYSGLTRLMEEEAMASLGQTTQLAATRLETTFNTLRQDARILSGIPPILGLLDAREKTGHGPSACADVRLWQGRLVRVFSEMLRHKPQYREARLFDLDGQELGGVQQIEGQISASVPRQPCAQQGSALRLADITTEMPANTAVSLSRAGADDGMGTAIVRAAIVVRDDKGRLRGRVTLDLLLEALVAEHAAHTLTPGLRFYVTDDDGHFLLYPPGEPLPTTIYAKFPGLAPMFGGARDTRQSLFVRHADDSDTALHYRRVPLNAGDNERFLGVAFVGSFKALTTGPREVARDSALFIVALSIGAGGLALLLVQIVVRPIRQLIKASQTVAKGYDDVELPLSAHNETGILARAFQMMLDKLRQREKTLAKRAAQLDRINGELQELIYVMAHDLRAPLRAVSGLASMIEEDMGPRLDSPSAKNIEALRDRVRRMDEFIDALLEFSRAGLHVCPAEPVHVGALLRDVATTVGFPPTMELHLPEYPPQLVTDRVRLAQVFANLIGNAVKHGGKARGNVWVGARELPGDFCEFSVRDDGPGIAPEHHGKIFGMFQTLNTKSTGECAGVGLAIVKKTVESFGGRVWVDSNIGKGSTFYFMWPMRLTELDHGSGEAVKRLAAPLS